ncbi:MOSC domain-containing protein [Engelhardtia mirabilis]|uniref:MOSC domain-containing protein n=1 Tax=Engelhardtia mirabilis TaxID=2528011 RepID=A0A518BGG1_9BACT|nr:hypothetical protein Pla133_11120 [Planctomycetes bacterium Pla133]QDV00373.1 hypothetical protein Pla86_11120 [Planctomycetes bacterium Pla86]
MRHPNRDELERRWTSCAPSPIETGSVELVVRRPEEGQREVLEHGFLDPVEGLVGDNWQSRGSRATADGSAHPELQLTLMNVRAAEAIAGDRAHWPLAGDQLFVDLDLSESSLPPGTRLQVGTAQIEITAPPHTGCDKFVARFGSAAMAWVSAPQGRSQRLRGVNARVVVAGAVAPGDRICKA